MLHVNFSLRVFQTFYYDDICIIKAGMCTFIYANVTAHNTKTWYISIDIGEKNPSVRKLCYWNTNKYNDNVCTYYVCMYMNISSDHKDDDG